MTENWTAPEPDVNDLVAMQLHTDFYCTYCHFYCTYCRAYGTDCSAGGTVFAGTWSDVVKHADSHPIGDPQDMVAPVDGDERMRAYRAAFADGYYTPTQHDIVNAIDEMTHGYVDALLWTARTNAPFDDVPEDETYYDAGFDFGDVSAHLIAEIREQLTDFVITHPLAVRMYGAARRYDRGEGTVWEHFGHDYLLTRDHHGAGFWDRGLGDLGEYLTRWTHADGESEADRLFITDDGEVDA